LRQSVYFVQILNLTKLLPVRNSDFVLTFNEQNLFLFSADTLDVVAVFRRRFGEIRNVIVDDSDVYVIGSVDTVAKYRISVEDVDSGNDEPDFASTVHIPNQSNYFIFLIFIFLKYTHGYIAYLKKRGCLGGGELTRVLSISFIFAFSPLNR
jgi:hypothetical protein